MAHAVRMRAVPRFRLSVTQLAAVLCQVLTVPLLTSLPFLLLLFVISVGKMPSSLLGCGHKKKKKTGRAQVGGSSTVLRHRYMHGHLFLFDRLVVLDCRRLLRVVPLLKTVNCAFVVSVLPVLHALRLHF